MKNGHKNARLELFEDAKRARMLDQVSRDRPSAKNLFQRVLMGTASPRAAIKAQCFHCTWLDVEAIRACTATGCPLWMYRPFQKGRATEATA